jgi:serine/threonine protein kinase
MLAPGTLLQNRYRIVRRIGHGGMGAVYEAQHEELDHTVALKETLHTEDESLRRAFKREARMLACLRHPALPRVTDYFTEGDGLFLVMEHVAGDDLMELLTRRTEPFPVAEVLRWADQLLGVLEYLHAQEPPVIHRDIKPNNIKLTERGDCVLLDFGLAKGASADATSVLASRSVLGFTLTYAPLEQIIKADPNVAEHLSIVGAEKIERISHTGTDARSDLYALGATLYHLLTNKQPTQSPTRALAVWSGRTDPLLFASEVNAKVPPAVAAVLHKALALEIEERPSSATEMRRMMSEATEAEPLRVNVPDEISQTVAAPTIISKEESPETAKVYERAQTKQFKQADDSQNAQTVPSSRQQTTIKAAIPFSQNVLAPALDKQPAREWSRKWLSNPRTYLLLVAVVALGAVLVWGYRKLSVPPQPPPQVRGVAFSPDGKMLASVGDEGLKLWDVLTDTQLSFNKGTGYASTVMFSPDGKMLVTAGLDGTNWWDVATGKLIRNVTEVNGPVAYSPDGKILAGKGWLNGYLIKFLDVQSGKLLRTAEHRSEDDPDSVSFSPNGKMLAEMGGQFIKLWDVATGKELKSIKFRDQKYLGHAIAFGPDGKWLVSASYSSADKIPPVQIWDVESGKELRAFKEILNATRMALSPDGKVLAVADENLIKLYDVASEALLQTLQAYVQTEPYDDSDFGYITSIAFSRDGKWLASGIRLQRGSQEKNVMLWRLKN